jgi:Abortive infection alpha
MPGPAKALQALLPSAVPVASSQGAVARNGARNYMASQILSTRAEMGMDEQSLIPVTDSQADAIKASAEFGKTAVDEVGQLARYIGRVLGTVPQDVVGIVIGEPLHFVRTKIAQKLDERVTKIHRDRKVKDTEPVSPSVAIPLLRAAYDESRPELQDLWARLIAAAMDPKRSDGMRLSFIDSVKRFDPLDSLVVKAIYDRRGEQSRPIIASLANQLNRSPAEVELSTQNLGALNCLIDEGGRRFQVSTYGSEIMRICSG